MDELPPDAKEFLVRAKGVHDPHDAQARARIEHRLLAALTLTGPSELVRAQTASRAGASALSSWLGGSKIILASIVLTFVAAGAWLGLRGEAPQAAASQNPASAPEPSAGSKPLAAPQVTPLDETRAAADLAAPPQSGTGLTAHGSVQTEAKATAPRIGKPAGSSRTQRAAAASSTTAGSSLAAEAALLARASERLVQHKAREAAELLAEHSRRYPNSQLHEEREGFVVMTRCERGAAGAPDEARAFVAEHPASVLVPRLSHLCAL
jgi:hypothetical protein